MGYVRTDFHEREQGQSIFYAKDSGSKDARKGKYLYKKRVRSCRYYEGKGWLAYTFVYILWSRMTNTEGGFAYGENHGNSITKISTGYL